MEYIDYYDYNQNKQLVDNCMVSINGTIFKSNVFCIREEFARNWLVREAHTPGLKIRNRGLQAYIYYEGKWFSANVNAQEDSNAKKKGRSNVQPVLGRKELEDGTLEENVKLLRCVDGSFKINFDEALTVQLAEKFSATAFAVRMNEKKYKTIDVGECIPMQVAYTVTKGEPVVYMALADQIKLSAAPGTGAEEPDAAASAPKTLDMVRLKDEDPVEIDGTKIPAALCRKLEERFTGMRIAIQPQKASDDKICWDVPSPWYDISQLDKLGGRKFAVYMWRGYEKKDPGVQYIYVGIAGNKDTSQNTVRDRISSEQKERPHIKVTHFRFSALQSWGKYSPAEILKTVEMQCINNFSALFPLAHGDDPVVIPVYEKAGVGEDAFILKLENRANRFRNG